MLQDYVHTDEVSATHSHRLGRQTQDEHAIHKRPLLVSFASVDERNKVLKLAKGLKKYKQETGQVVVIRPDLTAEQRMRQKAQHLQIKDIKAKNENCKVTMRNDRIYVDDQLLVSPAAPNVERAARDFRSDEANGK